MDKRYYCKRHPSHKQSKGVCPFCLRERLSHLTAYSSSSTTSLSNSSSAASSSFPADSDFLSSFLHKDKGEEPLKKSRSLAFVMHEEEEEEQKDNLYKKKKKKKKKKRFWSKLMGKRGEDGGELMYSKTMKDKSSAKWVVFS